jgi:hypothetical protein
VGKEELRDTIPGFTFVANLKERRRTNDGTRYAGRSWEKSR